MKSITSILSMIAASAALLVARGTTHTWTNLNTGSTLYWNVDANWDATFPNAAGAEAIVAGNFTTADAVIRLGDHITVGSLTIGDDAVDTTTGFSVTIANYGSKILTFQSATAGGATLLSVPVDIAQDPWYQADAALDAPVYLGGTSPLTVHAEGNLSLGQIYFQGNALTLTNMSGTQINLANELNGSGTSRLIASASTLVGKYNQNFTGVVDVNGGTMTCVSGGFRAATDFRINRGGLVVLGNNSATATHPGQRLPTSRVVFAGGNINDGGQRLKDAALDMLVGDVVDEIVVTGGTTRVQLQTATGSAGTYLRATELFRIPGAVLLIAADKLGANLDTTDRGQQFQVDSGVVGIGGGGAAGTTNMNVVPWAFCKNDYYGHGPDRLGSLTANGIRGLYDAEMDTTLAGTSDRNVKITTSLALTADQTLNALICDFYNASNLGAGRTLRLTSGALLLIKESTRIGEIADANAGTLDFGGAEGCVFLNYTAESAAAIGAVVAGSGGLTLGALPPAGRIRLTAANTYTGTTSVASGVIQVGDGTANTTTARLGVGDVRVAGGATLRIAANVANAIPNDRTVHLDESGLAAAKLDLQDGIAEAVRYLYLGGEPMVAGTYGSTASAAVHQDDRFFAGTGVLTVLRNAGPPSTTFIVVK